MPTLEQNRNQWQDYDWHDRGDEWSVVWGGSEKLWRGSIVPRIESFVPCSTILEIAPGFGRMTHFLKGQCRRLVGVDLTERCIEACRERFVDDDHLEFHVNDGKSLSAIDLPEIDLAFSFDSLVHVELDVIDAYLGELARVLSPNGVIFFHHSNIGAFVDHTSGELTIENRHWRGTSVSADRVRECCRSHGLCCIRQEIVNWGGPHLIDCFSVITRVDSVHQRDEERIENPGFMDEAIRISRS